MSRIKPNYREILRLSSKGLSQQDIATSVGSSKKTVNRILSLAKERNVSWPLPKVANQRRGGENLLHPSKGNGHQLDLEHMQLQLKLNDVNKKLLWREYISGCRLSK